VRVAGQVFCRHFEGKGFELNFVLTTFERFVSKAIDLFHFIISHGVTADRLTATMHHKKTPGPPKGSIKGVGITSIKGKILNRPWVHLTWSNVIKSLRRLVITLGNLRPELS